MVNKFPKSKDIILEIREKVHKSELDFYDYVDALNNDWYVWHSVIWTEDETVQIGEADFILFNHNHGLIVIEVKGGLISVEEGVIWQTNRRTKKKYAIDPFNQAIKSVHPLTRYYIKRASNESNYEKLLLFRGGKAKFPNKYTFGVVFSDTYFKDQFHESYSLRFYRIFDKSDCEDHEKWLSIGETGKSPLEKYLLNLLDNLPFTLSSTEIIRDYLKSIITPNLGTNIKIFGYLKQKNYELGIINEWQNEKLFNLENTYHIIFLGSAGSGKTFLAMKKALLNHSNKKKTLILCFNRELKEFIESYLDEKIKKKNPNWRKLINIYTVNNFLNRIIEVFCSFDKTKELKDYVSRFSYKIPSEEINKLKDNSRFIEKYKYDALLVDEAQDVDQHLGKILTNFLIDANKSIYYIFYDPEQDIFNKKSDPARFGFDYPPTQVDLFQNIRNSTLIAMWLKPNTNLGVYEKYSGIKGFKIEDGLFFHNFNELIRWIGKEINRRFLEAKLGTEKITVLSPFKLETLFPEAHKFDYGKYIVLGSRKNPRNHIYFIHPKKNRYIIESKLYMKTKNVILYQTISAYKGLENDIVFLITPNIQKFKEQFSNSKVEKFLRMNYVGASRAKFVLYVLQCDLKLFEGLF